MSSEALETSSASYIVRCRECREKYDAITAQWCECMTRMPTMICPHCQHCFCNAPHDWRLAFWAEAPADFVRRNPLRRRSAIVAAEPRRPLVLVVDDDPLMRLLGTAMIRKLGYGAVAAEDGEEGLRMTREMRPDLVLTDALMPRLDGRELARRIKTEPALAGIAVVVMSAVYTAGRYRAEAMTRFGADEYLVKPFDVGALSEVLAELIGSPAAAGVA